MPWKTVSQCVDTDTGEILAPREANCKNNYQLILVKHDHTNNRKYTRYYTKYYQRKRQLTIEYPESNTTSRNTKN